MNFKRLPALRKGGQFSLGGGFLKLFYSADRQEWRRYLEEHFETDDEVWFVFPMKGSGEESMSYNDAVEEALCFGWIDSIIKHTDELHRAQRFTPRKKEVHTHSRILKD